MVEQFTREDRYIVIKRKHLPDNGDGFDEWLKRREIEQVAKAVVVEGDWPEYEPVWRMIEARVTGQAVTDIDRCICALRGNLLAGLGPDARHQRDADISILETMKGGSTWSATAAPTSRCAEGAGDNAPALSQDRLLFDALAEFIYEATHLSPEREDRSHWCKISPECLSNARFALAQYAPPQPQIGLSAECRRMANGLRGSMWANRNEIIDLFDRAAQAIEARSGETAQQARSGTDESAVRQDAPKGTDQQAGRG